MRVTRSATRSGANNHVTDRVEADMAPLPASKRKIVNTEIPHEVNKRKRVSQAESPSEGAQSSSLNTPDVSEDSIPTAVAGGLELAATVATFAFEDAKKHLIRVDRRFEDLFNKLSCKPFQNVELVYPFRALVTSILGQQISWLAARSINHRFRRLYDPTLPEKPTDDHRSPASSFPTPEQVAKSDLAILRSAGLSGRKAEYILDLATRFADGRLSTKKLIEADDEELARMLIEVRGIGRWTVDMFAIFSLKRPDILPVGDLGVQRGLVRWFLTLHSPQHQYNISPQKVAGDQDTSKNAVKPDEEDALPVIGASSGSKGQTRAPALDLSSVPPATDNKDLSGDLPTMPPTFTPSIKKTLNKAAVDAGSRPIPLPSGLNVSVLKARLEGKKKIKGAFLTPKEMEELTESWRPYRSVGVYYMWSLADVTEVSA